MLKLQAFDVPDLFIFPNMGDAGLSAGAAYLCGAEHQVASEENRLGILGTDITESPSKSKLGDVECL